MININRNIFYGIFIFLVIFSNVGSAELAKVAPYHADLTSNIYTGSGGGTYADSNGNIFLAGGQAQRFMQTGTVTNIRFYAQNTDYVSHFSIQTYVKDESTGLYDLNYTTSDLSGNLNNGLNNWTVSIPVSEGDYYGVKIINPNGGVPILCTGNSTAPYQSIIRFTQNEDYNDGNFDWDSCDGFAATLSIDFYMTSPDVVFIGDSIISGFPLSWACIDQGEADYNFDPTKVIPYKFQTLSGWTYQNCGVSGHAIPSIYARLSRDVISKNPKNAVLEGGTNDISLGMSAEYVFGYMEDMIVDCQNAGIYPIVLMVIPRNSFTASQNIEANEYNTMLREYQNINSDFVLVDAREALGTWDGTKWTLDSQYTTDGTHLSEAGNAVLAQKIFESNPVPELSYPANGVQISKVYPPLQSPINFAWSTPTTGTSKIQVSEDIYFSNIISDIETTDTYATIQLSEGSYYWRVKLYSNNGWSYWSDVNSFTIINTDSSGGGGIVETGIKGIVYQAITINDLKPVSGALVTIYNDTYTITKTTGAQGYYAVVGLTAGTYYVSVKATEYDDSQIAAVNVVTNHVSTQNIVLTKSQSYFAPHFVKFVVYEGYSINLLGKKIPLYNTTIENAIITIYEGDNVNSISTTRTGSDGSIGVELSENIRYRINIQYDGKTQTEYIYPILSEYTIYWDGEHEELLPQEQFYEYVNISISKSTVNSSVAKIDINYIDNSNKTNSVYFTVSETLENGTLSLLNTSNTYSGNSSISFYVNNYKGETFTVKGYINHQSFGVLEKTFAVPFSGSNLAISGYSVLILIIIISFIIGAKLGSENIGFAGFLICGFNWIMWYLGCFEFLSTNTLIGVGLTFATILSLIYLYVQRR